MHILVTGGAGFIGSTLVDTLLMRGHSVDVIDNLSTGSFQNLHDAERHGSSFHFEEIDVCDPALDVFIKRRRPEVVFHLAAQASVAVSLDDPVHDAEINILGSLRVLQATSTHGVRKIVFAASGGTLYGDPPPSALPINETLPHAPTSPYGISKMIMLSYLRTYQMVRGLDFTALALANVYGPRQDPHGEAGVVAIFASNLARARRSIIFGDGEQTRDFVYVDDVADAFVRAIEFGSGRVLNIGTGVQTSINTLYRMLAQAVGSNDEAIHVPLRTGEVLASALDPSEARVAIGWQPSIAVAEGAIRVLAAQSASTIGPLDRIDCTAPNVMTGANSLGIAPSNSVRPLIRN